ncbi:MAG: hypothetical protein ACKV2T_41435 [Kofleriaceae bacterium]
MRYLIVVLAACGATPGSPAAPTGGRTPTTIPAKTNPDLSASLAKLSWWLGDWTADDGRSQEHWVAADGAIYGVSLTDDARFEAMIVDDASGAGPSDGIVRFFAMPGGTKSVEFRAETIDGTAALFGNPTHDDPKKIGYARTGDALRATLHADSNRLITFDFMRADLPRAKELELEDIAFAERTQRGGIDAWMGAFAPDGGMLRDGQRITGDAIRTMMGPVLADGTLMWAPTDSGIRGTLGFTVGKANFVGKNKTIEWRSTYVTIWKQQPDKSWKVLFDVGRQVNEPLGIRSEPAAN